MASYAPVLFALRLRCVTSSVHREDDRCPLQSRRSLMAAAPEHHAYLVIQIQSRDPNYEESVTSLKSTRTPARCTVSFTASCAADTAPQSQDPRRLRS